MLFALAFVVTGCNNNNEAALQDKRTDRTVPIGYYSNEQHDSKGGNAILLDGNDNDGPAIEIMDHTLGKERETNRGFLATNYNENNGNHPDSLENRQARERDPLIGGSDRNYHGHLNNSNLPLRPSYYTDYEGELAENVTDKVKRVENVKDARTVINGENVLIAIRLNDNSGIDGTRNKIQQAVAQDVDGKKVHILTNESQFNRLKVIDNDLRNGGGKENINKDIQNIIGTVNNQDQP